MAASALDKAKKSYSYLQKTLDSGISDVATVLTPNNVLNIPTDTGVSFVVDRVDSNGNKTPSLRELMSGVVSGSTITGLQRGEQGTGAKSHLANAVIEFVNSGEMWNDLIDFMLQDHSNPNGNHKSLTDDNGNEWLERGSVASAVNQVKITNAATGSGPVIAASGDDTNVDLNHNTKGAGMHYFNSVPFDPTNSFMNAIINGGCMVAQRVTAPNLSTSYQYGAVDRFAAKATGTAVSAGTIAQTTSPNVTSTGYALKLAGVTLTGTGIVYVRYRMEAKDALKFKNGATSFRVKIYQDTGGAINATVYVRKAAGGVDDFSSVTDIANSGAISVPNAAATEVKFENVNSGNIGDVTNGIEIEIQMACGAITTKNFEFSEFQFNKGAKALPFIPKNFNEEFRACQRYYEKSYNYATAPGTAMTDVYYDGSSHTRDNGGGNSFIMINAIFQVMKRTSPTMGWYNPVTGAGTTHARAGGVIGTNYTTFSAGDVGEHGATNGLSTNSGDFHLGAAWTADAEL